VKPIDPSEVKIRSRALLDLKELRDSQKKIQQKLEATVASLKSLTNRFQSLLSANPAVVYVSETEGDFGATYISPNVEQQLGYKAEQFLEDPGFWASNIHPEDAEKVFADLPKLFEEGAHAHEYRFRHRDGHYMWMVDQLKLIRDEKGEPLEIIGVWIDNSKAKIIEEQLNHLANYDGLTSIANRRYFTKLAKAELSRSTRYNHPFTLLLLDIDKFKSINDTYGHPTGDQVLIELAEKCQNLLRNSDIFGRFGGEEFAIVLVETDAEKGMELAERLRVKLSELSVLVDETKIQFTVSIGLTSKNDQKGTLDTIISRADNALYKAKESGRNKVVDFASIIG
jgi:diguanylate cyclase (GGDEF)-like protein/PAS domain S-box-containing protein